MVRTTSGKLFPAIHMAPLPIARKLLSIYNTKGGAVIQTVKGYEFPRRKGVAFLSSQGEDFFFVRPLLQQTKGRVMKGGPQTGLSFSLTRKGFRFRVSLRPKPSCHFHFHLSPLLMLGNISSHALASSSPWSHQRTLHFYLFPRPSLDPTQHTLNSAAQLILGLRVCSLIWTCQERLIRTSLCSPFPSFHMLAPALLFQV